MDEIKKRVVMKTKLKGRNRKARELVQYISVTFSSQNEGEKRNVTGGYDTPLIRRREGYKPLSVTHA